MKKILLPIFFLGMIASFSLTLFAADDNYDFSVSNKTGEDLENVILLSPDTDIITDTPICSPYLTYRTSEELLGYLPNSMKGNYAIDYETYSFLADTEVMIYAESTEGNLYYLGTQTFPENITLTFTEDMYIGNRQEIAEERISDAVRSGCGS